MWQIGVGSGIGAVLRYLIGIWLGKKSKDSFPIATLCVNLTGTFFLGMLVGDSLLVLGFFGGFTTFSTFGYEVIQLFLQKKYRVALVYVVLSFVFGLLAAYFSIRLLSCQTYLTEMN